MLPWESILLLNLPQGLGWNGRHSNHTYHCRGSDRRLDRRMHNCNSVDVPITLIISCVLGDVLIPAYSLPRNVSLVACASFGQFFLGYVWRPMPIYLLELSPVAIRSLIIELTY